MKKLNAEMWDKVQYIFRNYYDGMIHCAVVYEGIVDQAVMRKAIRRVVDKIDVLHSSFIAGAIKPYWVVNDNYTDEEMLYVHDGEVSHEAMERILTNRVDYRGKLQFKATLLRNEERQRSVLCLVINHICLDGRDFIALVKTIVEAYRGICADPDFDPVVKCGSRSAKQIYRDLPEELRKKAKMLYRNVSRTNIKNAFPFGEQCDGDKPHIVRATLSADKMSALKARGKADGYTVNDIYLAAYFTAAAKACGFKPDTPCEITSMLDMRRYLNDHETEGFTNLTSYMPCKLAGGVGNSFKETLEHVAEALAPHKSNPLLGMAGLPLMKFGLTFPFFIATRLVKLGYSNPLFTMSNMGVLRSADFDLPEHKSLDAFFTGTIKYKPYIQIAATTFDGAATFTVCEKCTLEEKQAVRGFLDHFVAVLGDYADGKI